MKKLLTVLIILTVCFAAFAGGAQETEESNVLTVAATPEPMHQC